MLMKILIVLFMLLFLGQVSATVAAPLPQAAGQWPMLHNSAQRNGRGSNTSGTNAVRWTFNAGIFISSSAAVGSDGAIYVGAWDNNLYALNPNGTRRWAYA